MNNQLRNLAGREDCDKTILSELQRARVPMHKLHELPKNSEVPYTIVGAMGPFQFVRFWTYWVVRGPVPLAVARELYDDPVGKDDIRAAGDAGCRSPETWMTRANGANPTEEEKTSELAKGHIDNLFVTHYHIDSEVGLRIFVDTLKAHRLHNLT